MAMNARWSTVRLLVTYFSYFLHHLVVGLPAVVPQSIRLAGGKTAQEGNVEVQYHGVWGSVCDDDFDIADATVACKQLGFEQGAISFTGDSYFGRGLDQFWFDNLQCTGHEKNLSSCKFNGWGQHDCTPMEAAGVFCRENLLPVAEEPVRIAVPKVRISTILPPQSRLQLTGGRTALEGRVEVVFSKSGLICAEKWSLREAGVVCRELGLKHAQQAIQGIVFGFKDLPFILHDVKCTGQERNLLECYAGDPKMKSTCEPQWVAAVVCAAELPDLMPNLDLLRTSAYLHDQALFYLQCAMEEGCLSSSANPVMSDPGWYYKVRRLLRFSTRVNNIGDADFLPMIPKEHWEWHQCHMHHHSMEVFSHYDILDIRTRRRLAEGHKASFCLEDSDCNDGIPKRYACASYGNQGISPGCYDQYLHDIDCQWIDISDLEPGNYRFRVAINPDYRIAEKNFSNNAVECDMYYNRIQILLSNCLYTAP